MDVDARGRTGLRLSARTFTLSPRASGLFGDACSAGLPTPSVPVSLAQQSMEYCTTCSISVVAACLLGLLWGEHALGDA
eukprot:scaffold3801_cov124-Isochrysis_galbana.AAC.15